AESGRSDGVVIFDTTDAHRLVELSGDGPAPVPALLPRLADALTLDRIDRPVVVRATQSSGIPVIMIRPEGERVRCLVAAWRLAVCLSHWQRADITGTAGAPLGETLSVDPALAVVAT